MPFRNFPWCRTLAVLLLAGNLALVYLFVIRGNTVTTSGSDTRTAIVLAESERSLVLTEMRQFLSAVQVINGAIADRDMERVASTAHGVGRSAAQAVPLELMSKLPLQFKQLGLSTHEGFDQIALDARDLGDPQHTLQQLSHLMANCVACHATYQLRLPAPTTDR